jgi:hypothetical protein
LLDNGSNLASSLEAGGGFLLGPGRRSLGLCPEQALEQEASHDRRKKCTQGPMRCHKVERRGHSRARGRPELKSSPVAHQLAHSEAAALVLARHRTPQTRRVAAAYQSKRGILPPAISAASNQGSASDGGPGQEVYFTQKHPRLVKYDW